MNGRRRAIVILAMVIVVAGCGDDDDGGGASTSRETTTTEEAAVESASEVTHAFEGREFTCEETLGIDPEVGCSDEVVEVWEEFGQDITAYVNSGHLGPLNDESFSFEDVAYAGVMACVVSHGGGDEQDFIDFMQDPDNNTQLEELSGTELLPAWFEAPKSLCSAGFSSGDYVTP